MRAALYLRISKDSGHNHAGVDRQEKACRALVAHLGWTALEPPYIDNDLSATKGRRPRYEQMLEDIEAGLVDSIVCWQPDRLYRVLSDLQELVRVCKARRVLIQTVNAGHVDLTTSTGQMVAEILASVASHEVRLKTERWLLSYEQGRVDLGLPFNAGWRTFGYTRENEIVPDEALEIRGMMRAVLDGGSCFGVARELNSRGVKTTRGNAWQSAGVRLLLLNPRIAGHVTMRGEIVRRNAFPAILTNEEHDALVAAFAARRKMDAAP